VRQHTYPDVDAPRGDAARAMSDSEWLKPT
jgi:hypothetical protein